LDVGWAASSFPSSPTLLKTLTIPVPSAKNSSLKKTLAYIEDIMPDPTEVENLVPADFPLANLFFFRNVHNNFDKWIKILGPSKSVNVRFYHNSYKICGPRYR